MAPPDPPAVVPQAAAAAPPATPIQTRGDLPAVAEAPHSATDHAARTTPHGGALAALALGALGVVYGDIGTSPLYALKECFTGRHGVEPTPANVLGILSLVFWAMTFVVTFKYLSFVMRADNRGEGGILALQALVSRKDPNRRGRKVLLLLGLFGAALLYGDGVITPAISVLSAVEGVAVAAPALTPLVVPLTVLLLAGLFLIQRSGTARVGAIFGPIMLAWFGVIGALGVASYIALAGLWGSPISGTSMNPARTFGPDLVGANFTDYWVYVAGPILGAAVAVAGAFVLRGRGGGAGGSGAAQGAIDTQVVEPGKA